MSAKGRVEHQKRNQIRHVYGAFGSTFDVQLDYHCRKKCLRYRREPCSGRGRVFRQKRAVNIELLQEVLEQTGGK